MRISFATAFAAPGEVPPGLRYLDKCERNFEFIHSLMKRAQANGELDSRFDSRDLAFGFYGQTNIYLMAACADARIPAEPADGGTDRGFVPRRRGAQEAKERHAKRNATETIGQPGSGCPGKTRARAGDFGLTPTKNSMKQKIAIAIVIVLLVLGGLAGVKIVQFHKLIAAASRLCRRRKPFPPPSCTRKNGRTP